MHAFSFKALKNGQVGYFFFRVLALVAFWNSLAKVDDKRCRETTMKWCWSRRFVEFLDAAKIPSLHGHNASLGVPQQSRNLISAVLQPAKVAVGASTSLSFSQLGLFRGKGSMQGKSSSEWVQWPRCPKKLLCVWLRVSFWSPRWTPRGVDT